MFPTSKNAYIVAKCFTGELSIAEATARLKVARFHQFDPLVEVDADENGIYWLDCGEFSHSSVVVGWDDQGTVYEVRYYDGELYDDGIESPPANYPISYRPWTLQAA